MWRSIERIGDELRLQLWRARVGVRFVDTATVRRVRGRCPGLPNLSGTPDATVGFAPSMVIGGILRIALPLYVALATFDLASIGASMIAGRVAFRVADPLLLRRADRSWHALWERQGLRRARIASRALAVSARAALSAMRGAKWSFGVGVALALLVLAGDALGGGGSTAVSAAGALAILSLLLSGTLAVAMLCALLSEMLLPTLLGPPASDAYALSRTDIEAFRPLLRGSPAGVAKDAWDVLRTLRP